MNPVQDILEHAPELRLPAAVLGLFSGYAGRERLRALCLSPTAPAPIRELSPAAWDNLFDRLGDHQLVERDDAAARFPTAAQEAFHRLLSEQPDPIATGLRQAFVDCYAEFSRAQTSRQDRPPAESNDGPLAAEESNLIAALQLTPSCGRWDAAIDILQALESLFTPAGHWQEWQWVLRSFEQRLLELPAAPPDQELWDLLMRLRVAVPSHTRDITEEERHLLRLLEAFEKADDPRGAVRTLRQLAQLAPTPEHLPAQEDYYRECLEYLPRLEDDDLHCAVLSELSRCLMRQKKYETAAPILRQARQIAIRLPQRDRELQLLDRMSQCAEALRDWEAAEECCRRILQVHEQSDDPAARAAAFERLGRLALNRRRPADAHGHFARSREIWRALGNTIEEAAALSLLGEAELLAGNEAEAVALYEQSLAMHIAADDKQGQARARARLGSAALEAHQLDQASEQFLQCQRLLGSVHDPSLEASILTGLARVAYCREAFASAQNFYQQTLAILERCGSIAAIADVLYNLGLVAERLNDLPRARKRHQRSLEFAAQAEDDHKQIQALLQLASIALQQGHLQEAQQHCFACLPMAERQNAGAELAEAHYRLGRIAEQLCRPQEAEEHFRKALEVEQPKPNIEWRLKLLSHFAALPQLNKAVLATQLQRTLPAAEKHGDTATQLRLLYKLVELAEADHDWHGAEQWLRRCLRLEQDAGSRGPQAQILQKIGLLLEKQGRPAEAHSLFLRSVELNGFPSGDQPFHTEVMLHLARRAAHNHSEDALLYFQHCLKIAKDLGDLPAEAQACLGLGRIALRQTDFDNTRAWLVQAHFAASEIAQPGIQSEILLELGNLEKAEGNLKAAAKQYQAALSLQESDGSEIGQADLWLKLAELAEDRGDPEEALICLERARAHFQVLRDALNLYVVRTAIQRLQPRPPGELTRRDTPGR